MSAIRRPVQAPGTLRWTSSRVVPLELRPGFSPRQQVAKNVTRRSRTPSWDRGTTPGSRRRTDRRMLRVLQTQGIIHVVDRSVRHPCLYL